MLSSRKGLGRSACIDEPQRRGIAFWLHARSGRGHGVHSPLLYSFCRHVLRERRHGGRKVNPYAELLQRLERWQRGARTLSEREAQITPLPHPFTPDDLRHALERWTEKSRTLQLIVIPAPRQNDATWRAWCAALQDERVSVSIDLFHYGILLRREKIAPHRVAVRPPLWLRRLPRSTAV